jgi:hypothetical protein
MNASTKSAPAQIRQWERGWDEHERMQLQRLACLPLAEKLQWLEEAHRVVLRLETARSPRSDDPNARSNPD